MRPAHRVVVSTLIALSGTVARADTDQFTFTPAPGSMADRFSFALPSSPIPDNYDPYGFSMKAVPMQFDGLAVSANIDFADLDSRNIGDTGGFALDTVFYLGSEEIYAYPFFNGPQLFTGTNARPTFVTGSIPFVEEYGYSTNWIGEGPGTLTISDTSAPSAATPEPMSLYLLGTGLLGGVGAVRRRVCRLLR